MEKIYSVHSILELEEGYRPNAYYCSERYPTIGIGTKIGPKEAPLSNYTFYMPKNVAYVFVDTVVDKLHYELADVLGGIENTPRGAVLLSLAYQVGVRGFRKFKNMVSAVIDDDWDKVVVEYLDSQAARNHPKRFGRGAEALRTNTYDAYNK